MKIRVVSLCIILIGTGLFAEEKIAGSADSVNLCKAKNNTKMAFDQDGIAQINTMYKNEIGFTFSSINFSGLSFRRWLNDNMALQFGFSPFQEITNDVNVFEEYSFELLAMNRLNSRKVFNIVAQYGMQLYYKYDSYKDPFGYIIEPQNSKETSFAGFAGPGILINGKNVSFNLFTSYVITNTVGKDDISKIDMATQAGLFYRF